MNSLAASGDLNVGAPVLEMEASSQSFGAYNTYDEFIPDWSSKGNVQTSGISTGDYTGDNITYVNETEMAYKNKVIMEEEASTSDAMKIAIGAIVAGIILVIAVALLVKFVCLKKRKAVRYEAGTVQRKLSKHRKNVNVESSDNPEDASYSMQYVPSAMTPMKRPTSKGSDITTVSNGICPVRSADSSIKSFLNEANDTNRNLKASSRKQEFLDLN